MDTQSNSTTAPAVSIGEAAAAVVDSLAERRLTHSRLTDVSDLIDRVIALNEAMFMAVTDILDRKQQSALKELTETIDGRLTEVGEHVEHLREIFWADGGEHAE